MDTNDFTTAITVDQSPEQVFDAVISPQQWWSGQFEGSTKQLNDEFTYRYKDMHYSKQCVTEFMPNKKVVWQVTDSNLSFLEDKHEWTGSKIVFEISHVGDKTQLKFTHYGISPAVECYDACSNAWSQLIQQSLYGFITTGKTEKPELA
ncbi:SRPBCC family protein [Mucilaginibacter auburnensis]|uniref:Uncharacterized protein YndB with AHSA1/START domain n=1 Tax=Mucilaginibacter auburnensis TaxID=1457233 RepID=A0A2H9VUK2_9SPHI|nr:SRPBCC domain-containing protein [Mucilaginibacter auburnensis]PJJ84504.1 uncharacterized protein YndB with AHSA1/START domain [Mucilaginibacter auburnensis]